MAETPIITWDDLQQMASTMWLEEDRSIWEDIEAFGVDPNALGIYAAAHVRQAQHTLVTTIFTPQMPPEEMLRLYKRDILAVFLNAFGLGYKCALEYSMRLTLESKEERDEMDS